jgi:ketosteroid isomerase-like protein
MSMSQADIELVRKVYAAWNEGGVDAMSGYWVEGDDWEFNNDPSAPERHFHGRVAVLRTLSDWRAALGPMKVRIEEAIDVGDGLIVLIVQVHGEGAESGVVLDSPMAHLLHVDGGLLRRMDVYFHREEGLRAAGLEP